MRKRWGLEECEARGARRQALAARQAGDSRGLRRHNFLGLSEILEEHGADELEGITLGDIERYHCLRNQLYKQRNILTVDL